MRIPSLRWRFWSLGLSVVILLTASLAAYAQLDDTGAVGNGDDGDSSPPPGTLPGLLPGDDDTQEHPGPLGRVDERLPHPACDACFTVPGLNEDRYTIFESVTGDDRENLILREIPNPAPLSEGEVRETVDEETGEPLWYIGRQVYSGPCDTDVVSDELQIPLIELKRTKAQQANTIMSIPGVHRFGIGERGFVVTIAPGYDATRIPQTIDGVPVEVQVRDLAAAYNHANERLRPVPTGAGITSVRTGTTTLLNNGTLGPPIVRTVGGCCQIWSLTAVHVVKHQLHDPNPAAGT